MWADKHIYTAVGQHNSKINSGGRYKNEFEYQAGTKPSKEEKRVYDYIYDVNSLK